MVVNPLTLKYRNYFFIFIFRVIPVQLMGLFVIALLSSCATPPPPRKTNLIRQKADSLFTELEPATSPSSSVHPQKDIPLNPATNPEFRATELSTKPYTIGKDISFTETGEGIAAKDEPQKVAEHRAEQDAISQAVKKAGVDVYYGFTDSLAQYGKSKYQFVARYLYTWTNALVSYEKVADPVFIPIGSTGIKCIVKIRGTIYAPHGTPDPNFEIRADSVHPETNQPLGLNQSVYFTGDSVSLSCYVSQDVYLHILNIDEDQNVYLLYPNRYQNTNFVPADNIFMFPDTARTGLTLHPTLPPDKTESIELIHIIATKKVPVFKVAHTEETQYGEYKLLSLGDLSEVTKKIAKLHRDQWTMTVLPYTIRKKGFRE